jgi:hypothetical protein
MSFAFLPLAASLRRAVSRVAHFGDKSGLALVLLGGFASLASAANPQLSTLVPPGARRGGEIEITLSGARLKDTQDLLFYYPGISFKSVAPVNDNSVKVKLAIAPDCRLGNHAVRVRTSSGVSNLMLFSVGALPEVAEAEPNNEFPKPQAIALDTTVNGVITSEDVDFFAIEAKKGERITAEVEGIRLGRTFFDPYVSIMDKDRFELASSDDTALLWHDAEAQVLAPEDGTYIVQVRESSFGGSGGAVYRLHVGRFPRPKATLPAGGKLGETVEVRFLGDVAGEIVQKVKLPSEPNAQFGLFAQDAKGVAPSPNFFRLGDLSNVIEVEPNNELKQATAFEAPMALNGVISTPGDTDYFKFKSKKGEVYDIRVNARVIRSPLDSVMSVYNSKGGRLAQNDDSGMPDSYLRFTAPADDEFAVSVTDLLNKGGAEYSYRVEVARVAPGLALTLPERQQYVDIIGAVPRGNRLAIMVNANRRDFGGDLALEFKGLPKGMTVEAMPIPANQTMVPVLLTAAEDAPLAGSLVDLVARITDPKQSISGHLELLSSLVRGDNQRNVWTHTTERMAAAVTEKAPFRIEIVEPKVPIVRNGSMDLKVKAIREPGFKEPIAIRMLYNPSGVSSSGAISIPGDKDEAIIPMTANGGSEIRSAKIAVIGEATVGNGPVTVSSQLAKLDVADVFFTLAFKPSAVEQGKETSLVVAVTNNTEFAGNAKIELVGLPAEVTADAVEISKDSTEAVFKVKTSAKSPAGRHKAIVCRAVVTILDEPIVHTLGPAELRIDAPLPPKAAVAAKPAPAKPVAVAAAKPVVKPLSRLEQLRQEREGNKPAPANK